MSDVNINALHDVVEARRRHEKIPDAPGAIALMFDLMDCVDFGARRIVVVAINANRIDEIFVPIFKSVADVSGHAFRAVAPGVYRVGDVRVEFVTASQAQLDRRKRVRAGQYAKATCLLDPVLGSEYEYVRTVASALARRG